MAATFKGIAELDLGKDVSAAVTPEFYRKLLDEVLVIGGSVVLTRGEITSDYKNPPVLERIDVTRNVPSDALVKLGKHAQAGYRMAVVLSNVEAGLRVLESRGYERCAITSPGSEAVIRDWEAWLEHHLSDVHGALVFGHDYEPAFIFEKLETK